MTNLSKQERSAVVWLHRTFLNENKIPTVVRSYITDNARAAARKLLISQIGAAKLNKNANKHTHSFIRKVEMALTIT